MTASDQDTFFVCPLIAYLRMVIIMEMAMAMTMAMVQLPRPPAEPSSVLMSWPEGEALTIDH